MIRRLAAPLRWVARFRAAAIGLAVCTGVATFAVGPSPLEAQTELPPPAGVERLFESPAPLVLRIEADLSALRGDRDEENDERPARLVIVDGTDGEAAFDVELRTRGNFRLQSNVCPFPPLRLDVPRRQMEGTAFEGQDKLKMVTHCRDTPGWDRHALREFLVYRIYNRFSEASFQVRLARVTWVDTGGAEPLERWAFLLESEDALAQRLGGTWFPEDEPPVDPARIGDLDAVRLDLFQYLVGNTDYSIYGLHNVVVLMPPEGRWITIPYDFDWTGFVDAPYAAPDPSLGIDDVRERTYRGLCRPRMDYASVYALFLGERAAVEALVRDQPGLDDESRADLLEFLEPFWDTLSNPDRARRAIERECR
ncbi:MAG: hypothetical protein RLN75_00025 [Longimicrobiales bacterium]